MSASQSTLDTSRYGYDIVVATTQLGINSTMKWYLSEQSAPVITCCYVGDGNSSQPIDYELLKKQTGADPFAVPNGENPAKNPDLINLTKAGFLYGFRLQIGLPPVAPEDTPDIIGLGGDATHVRFSLLSTELDVVGFVPPSATNSARGWSSLSQPYPGNSLWIFECDADLQMGTVPPAEYATLPKSVKDRLATVDTAFSIQQLFLDLSSATLVAIPDVKEWWGTPLASMLQTYFPAVYMDQLRALVGNPVLNYAIIQQPAAATPTEFPITGMGREVSPVVGADGVPVANPSQDQKDLNTLNYLCATDNHPLPAPRPFTWNWVDDSERTEYDGVVAVNRASLVDKIRQQMLPNVIANCYQPYVRVSIDWTGAADITMSVKPGGQPQVDAVAETTKTPGTIQALKFTYHGHDEDSGSPSWYGEAGLDTYYDATITFGGTKITVEQNQRFDAFVKRTGATTTGSPIVVKRVDVCELTVSDEGQLIAVMSTPTVAENKPTENSAGWWGQMTGGTDSLYASSASVVGGTVGTMLNILPFSVFQYLVFPGGQTFSYTTASFAGIGDLVSHIVYADPDSTPPDTSLLPGQVASGASQLNDGQWLGNDGYLLSPNKLYAAYVQDDGNFVLMHTTDKGDPDLNRPYWSVFASATDKIVGPFANGPCYASMQSDGNFVLYNGRSTLSSGPPYWAINHGLPALGTFAAALQDDGDFAVYKRDPVSNALTGVIYRAGSAGAAKAGQPPTGPARTPSPAPSPQEPAPSPQKPAPSPQEPGKPQQPGKSHKPEKSQPKPGKSQDQRGKSDDERKHDHLHRRADEKLPPERGHGR